MMEPDLWLTIVPGEFDQLIKKARSRKDYAGWLAFTDIILKDKDLSEFDDGPALAVIKDVLKLKEHYHYSYRDFFFDTHHCTGTLDYLLDHEIELRQPGIPAGILRDGGQEIAAHVASMGGIPLKLYSPEQVSAISDFMTHIDFRHLSRHYDDEKPIAFGMHRLQAGNQEDLSHAYTQIKALFKRAHQHTGAFVLKKID